MIKNSCRKKNCLKIKMLSLPKSERDFLVILGLCNLILNKSFIEFLRFSSTYVLTVIDGLDRKFEFVFFSPVNMNLQLKNHTVLRPLVREICI